MILSFDFGTGGIKAALFDEKGNLLRDAFSAYDTLYPFPGFHEQRPEDWWQAVISSSHTLGDLSAVKAIGISGHSLGVVPIDKEGNLLRETVPIWSDSRATKEAEKFGADDAWYMRTGCGFPPGLYSAFKLMWFKEHESEWFSRVDTVLGTKDWINFKLCGAKVTDNSYATGTGVYDLKTRAYSEDLIARTGLDESIFPKIVPSFEVIGEVDSSVARLLGLPENVKVVAGGVDNSCMALGAGAFLNGRAYASLGSSAWIAVSGSSPVLDPKTRPYVFDHVVPGQYASALAIFSAGTSLFWLRDVLGLDYKELDALAEKSGIGARGLFFNPSLAGGSSLDPSPALRGGFAGLELRHTKGDLARAVLEGVSYGLKTALVELKKQVPVSAPLILTGGGAKSRLWQHIYADIFGMDVCSSSIGQQCAALGAATLALVGIGIWKDFSPILCLSSKGDSVCYNKENASFYESGYERFMKLTHNLASWGNG
jgi:xylulokinase